MFIFEDQESIYIEVEDRGIGIDEENIAQIFKNGYSTKPGSRGTGLFLVKSTVDELKGSIEVDSEVGFGSIFRVTLNKELKND